MPLRGGQVGSLKKGSLPVPGLQERQSSGRLLSGSRRAKVVRDSSKASIHCHDLMATSMIRRHVTREGRQLGCDRDSPPSPDELLMMIFYDVLLLDDNHCIYETYKHRRQRLTSVVHPVPGHAEIGERQKIDFAYADAPLQLAQHLAYEITQIWEGLVLKACQGTYILVQGVLQQQTTFQILPTWWSSRPECGSHSRFRQCLVEGECDEPNVASTKNLECVEESSSDEVPPPWTLPLSVC